jgi:Fe-S-cluster-containing hydrogenase component 2
MATLELELKECRIAAEGLECAICAEICPLHAIEMKTFADQEYPVPVVIQEKCNGCGKCLYRCPVRKKEEIFRFYS